MRRSTPIRLVRAVFGREANTYAGSDIELARRFARVLWPAGTMLMLALVPFFPPTTVIGAWGWIVPAIGVATMVVNLVRHHRNPEFVTYELLYWGGYFGLAMTATMQWLGGGGPGPHPEAYPFPNIGK